MNEGWKTFATVQGICGVSWNAQGVTGFYLPELLAERIEQDLRDLTGIKKSARVLPDWIKQLIQKIKIHIKGELQDFSTVPLVFNAGSEFVHAVYRAARKIPAGSVVSYAELAAALGNPGAVRAVGTALGKNPIPLLVPCHRIVAASGKLGGFSAPGGLAAKTALLECEGVCLTKPVVITSPAHWQKAIAGLQKQDKAMARLIKRVAPFEFKPHLHTEPLSALISAIVSQQLSVKAAATILARVNALITENGVPHPEKLLATSDIKLREAGLSYMKVSYLKDLAQRYLIGLLPPLEKLQQMSDQQIIKNFTQIKGVGRWTVEMYLIFNLGRADIWPTLDLGVRKGIALLNGLPETPAADEAEVYGENWRPYRTVAALYLWRSLDNKS